MFCAPITLLHYFQEYKTGGLFCPPSEIIGEAKQLPSFMFLKYCNNVFSAQTCRCILGCIAYIFNRGVEASQANLLKKTLFIHEKLECFLVYLSHMKQEKLKSLYFDC